MFPLGYKNTANGLCLRFLRSAYVVVKHNKSSKNN
nr:MAG TPA: hypothetical protein [Caudoviricetes sp.]